MRMVYSAAQRLHAPAYQQSSLGRTPYPEQAIRLDTLAEALPFLTHVVAEPAALETIGLAHSADYIEYLTTAYEAWVKAGHTPEAVLPAAVASRAGARRPVEAQALSGWYCVDTFTPIVAGTFEAACASAGAAVTAARLALGGERAVYALCRPPGHHAGPDYCGGFCYLNNAAVGAAWLRRETGGRVAILDIDYHHGNGTQHIFYETDSVLFVSIHADPRVEFPYYSGHADETGSGKGLGYTVNLPLVPRVGEAAYGEALRRGLEAVGRYTPDVLVVSFGADVCRGDVEGDFGLEPEYLGEVGRTIATLDLPTVIVQEGGYTLETLPRAIVEFLRPFAAFK